MTCTLSSSLSAQNSLRHRQTVPPPAEPDLWTDILSPQFSFTEQSKVKSLMTLASYSRQT